MKRNECQAAATPTIAHSSVGKESFVIPGVSSWRLPLPTVTGRHLQSPVVPRRPPSSPAVPCRPPQSPQCPAVPPMPRSPPHSPVVPRHPPQLTTIPTENPQSSCTPCILMSQIAGPVVLGKDGRLLILRTRTAYFLPSRPVLGSWQSVLRAL